MIGINDVMEVLEQISLEVQRLPARIKIAANQVTVTTGLSDISKRLGLVSAGEFRSGNEKEPGFGFSGVRIGYPPFSYNSEDWSIVGINNDTLQFGINASDGKAYFGGGAAIIDVDGITLPEGDIGALIADTSAVKWEDGNGYVSSYIQSAKYDANRNSLIWSHRRLNAGGSVLSYVQTQEYAYDSGAASYAVWLNGRAYLQFTDDTTKDIVFNGSEADVDFWVYGNNGSVIKVNGELDRFEIMNLTGTAIHILDGAGTSYFNEPNADVDMQWEGVNNSKLLYLDASADKLTSLAWDGWASVPHTWTRTGNHTFTVSGDVTATYRKGAKVRYGDGATDYGVIASSSYSAPNTTVTLITNSDYAMAAATITDTYLSYIENPEGFPQWFNYTITWSASGSMTFTSVTTNYAKWWTSGGLIKVIGRGFGTTGGTANVSLTATLPVTPSLTDIFVGTAYVADGGAALAGFCFVSSSLVNGRKTDSSNYGLGTGRYLIFDVTYEF